MITTGLGLLCIFIAGAIAGLFVGSCGSVRYHRKRMAAMQERVDDLLHLTRSRGMAAPAPRSRAIRGYAVTRSGNVIYCAPELHR